MTYSPTATGPGQTGYWGDTYGSSAVSNQFIVGRWKSKNRKYTGNLGTAKYYPIVNKQTGDIAVVKVNPFGNDTTVGTISAKDGDFKEIDGTTSQAENYYFNLPENAKKVADNALNTAQNEYNNLNNAQKAATKRPNNLINALNNIAAWSVNDSMNQAGAAGVNESVPAPPSSASGNAPGTGQSGDTSVIIFPTGVDNNGQDLIEFASLQYSPKTVSATGTTGTSMDNKTVTGRVILPIPGGINDNNSVDWGSANMNAMEMAGAAITLAGIERGGDGFADEVGQTADAIKDNAGKIKEALGKTIAGQVTGTGQQLMQRTTGQVMNPNMELLFNGPSLRSFGFTFKLAPRTSQEAENIVKIIRLFKQKMAPVKSDGNLFLKSPDTWRIKYLHSGKNDHKFLNKFKECAMMSTSVNYTPDGNYATYSDGSMVSYSLTLNFQEIEPVFNTDYDNVQGIGY